jgi:hypothetical protein
MDELLLVIYKLLFDENNITVKERFKLETLEDENTD